MSFDLKINLRKGDHRIDIALEKPDSLRKIQNDIQEICQNHLGAEYYPSKSDPEFSKFFLENDLFIFEPETKKSFKEFCKTKSIDPSTLSSDVYHEFWTRLNGLEVGSILCPIDPRVMRSLYYKLIEFCLKYDLALNDPQAGKEINLTTPEEPPY